MTGPGHSAGHQRIQHLNAGGLLRSAWRTARPSSRVSGLVPPAGELGGRRQGGLWMPLKPQARTRPLPRRAASGRTSRAGGEELIQGLGERRGPQSWAGAEQAPAPPLTPVPVPGHTARLTWAQMTAASCDEGGGDPGRTPARPGRRGHFLELVTAGTVFQDEEELGAQQRCCWRSGTGWAEAGCGAGPTGSPQGAAVLEQSVAGVSSNNQVLSLLKPPFLIIFHERPETPPRKFPG